MTWCTFQEDDRTIHQFLSMPTSITDLFGLPLLIIITTHNSGAPAGFQARVGKIRREAPKNFFRLPTLVFSLPTLPYVTVAHQGSFRGGTRGNAIPIVAGTHGNGVPIVKVFKNAQNSSQVEKTIKTVLILPYAKPRVVVQLSLTKIIKIVANRWRILCLKCTKFDFGGGSAPDPAGEFTAPPDP